MLLLHPIAMVMLWMVVGLPPPAESAAFDIARSASSSTSTSCHDNNAE